ncbi:DUF2267 domain-containing protein [Streptomyces sp. XD-27]|uniref:DUF2267 domain-containing protein n=1 Tax=Streptomyces sp. XD-27 TaxID=3062779 RepID=UPI0026F467F4|nr:DUF2267 domain-containing protein [Streptomyces sp. XD-27]WKX73654.1 DUF2267 domain-containing protein [Streptomyces sp. XD-27]
MSYEDFLANVQERGGYDATEAERVTDAVLTALGERLAPESVGHLADQLPMPLADVLNDAQAAARTWGVEEFVSRVAGAVGTDEASAETAARSVLSALADQVSRGELNKLLSQLPAGYAELFGHPEPA